MAERPALPRLGRGAAIFVGLVLLATGLGKLLDIEGFTGVVASYDLVGPDVGRAVATTLPFVELATGLGLLFGSRRPAAWVAVGLHLMLVGVVVTTLARGLEVANCGCFGVFFARPLGISTLVEDLVMLGLSVLALRSSRGSPAVLPATSTTR